MKTYEYPKNGELFTRALKVIPQGIYGHLGPVEGCNIPVSSFPRFSSRAEGAYFWDADGNRFIDYMCAYGPNILGYGDPDVDAAAMAQLKEGNCVTAPGTKMIELAELLVDTVAMADWAFFCKNGGDTTSFAVMLARASTGRDEIVLTNGGYHGAAPWTQRKGLPGITDADVANNHYVDFGDFAQLERLFSERRGKIACFMATPYHHPVFQDNVLPPEGYWAKVRKLCDEHGVVLAVDDVRCGWRLDVAGSDHYFGFKADLLCFCKALGNGWNVSALCGTDAMRDAVGKLMYTGSYWLSAAPIAAAVACVTKMRELDVAKKVTAYGARLGEGLKKAAADNGFRLVVSGHPAMWFMRVDGDDSLMIHQQWVAECVRRGAFFTNHHNHFVCAAMSDADLALTVEIADDAFKAVRKANPGFPLIK